MPSNLVQRGSSGPAHHISDVAPSDGTDLPGGACLCLFVGGGGAVRIRAIDGSEATIHSADAQYHPVRAARILASGTTATGIVALY